MKKRKAKKRRRHVKRTRFQIIVRLLLWTVVMTALLSLTLWATSDQEQSLFSIRSVSVVGNEHYDDEAVIGISGLYKGKSVLTMNKSNVRKRLINNFAYIQDVSVEQGDSFRDVIIKVTEQEVFAATYHEGEWLLIGENGRLVEKRPVKSDTPERMMLLKLASKNETLELGDTVVLERDQKTIDHILAAFEKQKLTGITEIDLSNRNDIRVHWNNRLEIRLGNNTNLDHEIAVVAVTIPKINDKHGKDASGVLDLRSYADSSTDNTYAVFTPQALVTTTTLPMSSTTVTDQSTTQNEGSATAAE